MYNKDAISNIIATKMQDIELKLNLVMNISDFENFTYSEKVQNPIFDEELLESNFAFPVTTCSDNELILLADS